MRLCSRREKVFGPGHAVPLDRNAKCRVEAYARAWSRLHAHQGQHPVTRAFLNVLSALLWGFHNSRSGCCFLDMQTMSMRALWHSLPRQRTAAPTGRQRIKQRAARHRMVVLPRHIRRKVVGPSFCSPLRGYAGDNPVEWGGKSGLAGWLHSVDGSAN
jgi:hypothetical protein